MEKYPLPYAILKYQPAGKRNPGRPMKRLLHFYIERGMSQDSQVPDSIMLMTILL
jgi:hypothetical protein